MGEVVKDALDPGILTLSPPPQEVRSGSSIKYKLTLDGGARSPESWVIFLVLHFE